MTASLHQGGYLNFMGNEFGHPEWIDFPREGNNWSYAYAKRQWQLADNKKLKYHWLGDFDKVMIGVLRNHADDMSQPVTWTTLNDPDQVMSFMRGNLLYVFNLSPVNSYEGYGVYAPDGEYTMLVTSDDKKYGGFGRVDDAISYQTQGGDKPLKLYIPARTCAIYIKA